MKLIIPMCLVIWRSCRPSIRFYSKNRAMRGRHLKRSRRWRNESLLLWNGRVRRTWFWKVRRARKSRMNMKVLGRRIWICSRSIESSTNQATNKKRWASPQILISLYQNLRRQISGLAEAWKGVTQPFNKWMFRIWKSSFSARTDDIRHQASSKRTQTAPTPLESCPGSQTGNPAANLLPESAESQEAKQHWNKERERRTVNSTTWRECTENTIQTTNMAQCMHQLAHPPWGMTAAAQLSCRRRSSRVEITRP